jgi:predicted O-methyltransferase YrrM
MDKPLIPDYLMEYIESLVPPRPPEMQAMEDFARRRDFPIIGPTCGHLCYQIARMIGAHSIFELGSGFGYSTAWFAQAVLENGGGEVWHVVWEQELSHQARQHLAALGLTEVVRFEVGEAVAALRRASRMFDLIFLDIEKEDYPAALEVITEKLRPGGVLIADNMLWGGRIFNAQDKAASTEGIRALTQLLTKDAQWVTTLLPLRDGVMLAFKR